MFTTKNRNQRWGRLLPVMLLSLTMLSPPWLALETLGSGAGGVGWESLFLEMPRRTFSLQLSR